MKLSTNKSASQCRHQYYLPEPLPSILFIFMKAFSLALREVQLHAPQCPATYHFCIARLASLRHDLRIAGSHLRLALLGASYYSFVLALLHGIWVGGRFVSVLELQFDICTSYSDGPTKRGWQLTRERKKIMENKNTRINWIHKQGFTGWIADTSAVVVYAV